MPYFTIFTPTYNRAHTLPALYQSLCRQTFLDFEWLIVDDGSIDHTQALVSGWQSAGSPFPIVYFKKKNGGKPRAINFGVQHAAGRFFFLMDSDDRLLPQAMEKMYGWCREIEGEPAIIGVGAARGDSAGRYLKGRPPATGPGGYVDATNLQRKDYALDADMCEAYKTALFRRFPMAEWPGEKFAPEQIALNNIALAGYRLRWHGDIIYLCDYLEDGLTRGSARLEKQNPMGYAMMYNHMLLYPGLTRKEKFYAACQSAALSIYGRHAGYLLKSNSPGYTLAALPAGCVLAIRRRLQFREV